MHLELLYGRGSLALEIPEKNILACRRPNFAVTESISSQQKILLEAINEFGILRLSPIFAGRPVGVIVDAATSGAELIAVMLPFLRGARFVQFLLAAGNHAPDPFAHRQSIEAIHAMIADFDFPEYAIHACDSALDEFIEVGRTARGTPVQVNELSARCDIFLVISVLQNHEFAGYSSPLHNFLPGICSRETKTRNQALALDERSTFGAHPFHPAPHRRHNPLADDMWEGVQMILRRRPVLALATISSHNQLQWAKIGPLSETIAAGIQKVDALASFTLPPANYLIVSPGGYPDDESLYTAQRALELTKNAIHDGGEVLLLSNCENGIGPPKTMTHFYDLLTKPLPQVLKSIEADYELNLYKAYKFAQMIQRLHAMHLHSSLSNEAMERLHLRPCADAQALVNGWLTKNPHAQINIFDGANELAIYAE